MDRPPLIFDQHLLDARRRRALRRPERGADFLYRIAASELIDRLSAVTRRFPLAVEIGSSCKSLHTELLASGQVEQVVRMDRLRETRPDIVADADALPLRRSSVDLAVSLLWLQWANDLPGALAQIRGALKPDGLFLAALVAGDTLLELRQAFAEAEVEVLGGASPHVAPFADVRTLGALLQRVGFALPVADQDRHTVRYDSALSLMRDLRAMGVTNVLHDRDRRPLRRTVLDRMVRTYAGRFTDPDGRIPATFDFVWLSGWSPHESQQRPLSPGSARMRLADTLGVREQPAGDKARPRPAGRPSR